MRQFAVVVLLAFALVTACSAGTELEGVDLPPAAVPADVEPEAWAVTFAHSFPASFWEEGVHQYSLALACDAILDEPMRTDRLPFESITGAQAFEQPVFLRIVGLSHSIMGPRSIVTIAPKQLTVAALTIIGVSRPDADAAVNGCAGAVIFDAGNAVPLAPLPPFRP